LIKKVALVVSLTQELLQVVQSLHPLSDSLKEEGVYFFFKKKIHF